MKVVISRCPREKSEAGSCVWAHAYGPRVMAIPTGSNGPQDRWWPG